MDVSSAVRHAPGTLLSMFCACCSVCLFARACSATWGACRGHACMRACCQRRPHEPLPHHKLDPELSSGLPTTQHPCPCQSCPVRARRGWRGYCSPQQSPCPAAQHQQDPRPPSPSFVSPRPEGIRLRSPSLRVKEPTCVCGACFGFLGNFNLY